MSTEQFTRYGMIRDADAIQAVERLRTAFNLKTHADVYDLATRVLKWAHKQQQDGCEIGRYKDGTFQPLRLPKPTPQNH